MIGIVLQVVATQIHAKMAPHALICCSPIPAHAQLVSQATTARQVGPRNTPGSRVIP